MDLRFLVNRERASACGRREVTGRPNCCGLAMNPPKDSGRTELETSIIVLLKSLGDSIGRYMVPMRVRCWRSKLMNLIVG